MHERKNKRNSNDEVSSVEKKGTHRPSFGDRYFAPVEPSFTNTHTSQAPQGPSNVEFQQPFNMAIPQPNLFSGLQQDIPAQQQAPYIQDQPQPTFINQTAFPSNLFKAQPSIPVSKPPLTGMGPTNIPMGRSRDAITPPSAESGGIPDPTSAYLVRASFLPQRRQQPGPLLVVIDLNGTVLHRPNRSQATRYLTRRHALDFVKYCIHTFWVVIWSSARPENVHRMINTLLPPNDLRQVVAVWGREKFGLTVKDYNARTQCYKRLTKLWNDPVIKASFPSAQHGGGGWGQGNTVLIDDSVEKARSEPHNAITLPEFTGQIDEPVDVLPSVHDYLNELCYQEDVSAYMRANPFNIMPTETAIPDRSVLN